ncbi:MAG: hypothetical protein HOP28_16675 [Gemmatimonadales bacterium]|nr:hypothetical protein [Gemmatimonadales bacterium]
MLLEHTDGFWQLVPLTLLGLALVVLVWHQVAPSAITVRAFQAVGCLFVLSGAVGVFLHYRGNAEFELEMSSGLAGWKLIWESLKGATPTLAPGAMLQLGLLALGYTFRHPALGGGNSSEG